MGAILRTLKPPRNPLRWPGYLIFLALVTAALAVPVVAVGLVVRFAGSSPDAGWATMWFVVLGGILAWARFS